MVPEAFWFTSAPLSILQLTVGSKDENFRKGGFRFVL